MDETNQVLLSAAVVWEIAVKRSLGRLEAPDDLAATLLTAGARPLAITLEHAAAVEALPWHHRVRSIACWSPRPCTSEPLLCRRTRRCMPTG